MTSSFSDKGRATVLDRLPEISRSEIEIIRVSLLYTFIITVTVK